MQQQPVHLVGVLVSRLSEAGAYRMAALMMDARRGGASKGVFSQHSCLRNVLNYPLAQMVELFSIN